MSRLGLLVVVLLLAGCARPGSLPPAASPTAATTGPAIALEPWLSGFQQPLLLTFDGAGVAYVVEQGGRVYALRGEERALWLDLTGEVSTGTEQGLLGLAFEPDDDRAYVSYTDARGDSKLERRLADGAREVILAVDQPYANHNGGHVLFGPDGFLYYGLGDGGAAGDPQGNGQDPESRLGSILRLDVSDATGYRAAAGNPWGDAWAKGLRNPWRFSFDRETGDFWVADVGQNAIEEVDVLRAPVRPGANFGWSAYEGTRRYALVGDTFSAHTPPVAEYTHDDGCSVTGGFVYRGAMYPQLQGLYFLADYCSGKVWGLREKADGWRLVELLDTDLRVTSFGEDPRGEIFVVDHGGGIYRLAGTGAALPDDLRR